MNIGMKAIKTSKSVKSQCYVKLAVQKMKNIRIPSGKLTSLAGKSPFSIGNTSTQRVHFPAIPTLLYRSVLV